jgi:alkaline phosphatase D
MSISSRVMLYGLLIAVAPDRGVAQGAPALRSGPMVGATEMREVRLWAQTTRPALVQVVYWDSAAPVKRFRTAAVRTSATTAHIAHLLADSVQPGITYRYELRIDGVAVPRPYPLRFRTPTLWQHRTDPPALRIAIGSCFYVNEARYDRPGAPYGSNHQILTSIAAQRPDLMLWMGDNTYMREPDWYTRTGVLHRYSHTRALPELQPLLAAASHYATWDDHDFGPNDSDRSFRDRAFSREAFGLFWPSAPFGADGGGGVTSTFEWQDVQVFLTDNRWYRNAQNRLTGEQAYLGRAQIEWLIDALRSSRAPFKFVVVGGQVINTSRTFENYATYADERKFLLDRITEEKIPGVIFLTGDKHWTELSRMPREGTYPLYDLTVSPLTAGTSNGWQREQNDHRVEGTLLQEHNFGLLDVSGPRTDRVLTIRILDKDGTEKWTRRIAASELR